MKIRSSVPVRIVWVIPAVQINMKEYLVAHNLKQKQFLIQLIESALEDTEKE